MKDLENDKDVLLVKQHAYITYLEHELSNVNLENGKNISEINHLRNKLHEVYNERKKLITKLSSYENGSTTSKKHLEQTLKERNLTILNLRKQLSNDHV